MSRSKKEKLEAPPKYRKDGAIDSVPGINTPGIELPAFNPPVPNRAWTAMKNGSDALPEDEKLEFQAGRDEIT